VLRKCATQGVRRHWDIESRIDSIFTSLVNFCWSLFKWTLVLALTGVLAVGGYLYFRLDDEIRRQVEQRFANHYVDFDVHVGSARFDPDRGIAVDNLSLTRKTADGATAEPVISIGELYLSGNLRIEQLLTNQMQINDIVVRHANLRMERQADGTWNTSELLPLPHFSEQSPRITIEDASGTVTYSSAPESKPIALRGVNFTLTPVAVGAELASTSKRFHIEGTAIGLPAREVRIEGTVGTAHGDLDVAVTALGLDISPELLGHMPASAVERLNGASLSGQANVTLRLNRPNGGAPIGWSSSFSVERGRLTHASLPEPISEITLKGTADAQRLAIERLDAKYGPANILLAMNRSGWTARAPMAISGRIVGLALTDRLETALPESASSIWKRFRPLGDVDADVRLTFDGESWKPFVTAQCRGISLTDAKKFPYPLEQACGRVVYRGAEKGGTDQLSLDLAGVGGGRPIKVAVQLSHLAHDEPQGPVVGEGVASSGNSEPINTRTAGYRGVRYARAPRGSAPHPVGFIEVSGTDIPLHEQLLVALPPKAEELVRSLQAEGAIDFRFRCEWTELSQLEPVVTQEIRLKDCRLRYGPFPYPLQHVQGLVTAHNSKWTVSEIEARGSSDSTTVKCRGEVVTHDSGCEADMTFEAMNVPLDENLRQALAAKPAVLAAWDELKPQGNIEFTARATRQPNELEPHVEVTLRPCGQSVSLEPRAFPLRLEQIEGVANYKQGKVDLKNLVARHDRAVYSAESGLWQLMPDGGWQCSLSRANIDRLAANRELLVALPPAVQAVVERLQPTGSIGLYNGSVTIAKSPQMEKMMAAWDLTLECQQAAILGGSTIRGINGGIRLVGRSDGQNAFSAGELALDSVLWKDVQLTNVRGPFWTDAAHCLMGEPACKQQNQPLRRLTADAYGGSLATNIELEHGQNPSYKLDVHLGGANLARFASERLGGPKDMNGTLSGKLVVAGNCNSPQTMRGAGELHVVDANIYELPLLVAMLKVLKNRTPDSTAFNRCDMDFVIQGEHIDFRHLNLLGDAVSLYGKGEADFSRRLDLEFYTLIGPADLPIPFLKTFAGHVSQQGLQLKVVGKADDPKIERKAFPAINDMINQLQTGVYEGAATITPASASRMARPPAR